MTTARLNNQAMATSSPYGYFFDALGYRHHHLFDPRSGRSSNRYRSVTVMAPSATFADGLSTAMTAMSPGDIEVLMAKSVAVDVNIVDIEENRLHFRSKTSI